MTPTITRLLTVATACAAVSAAVLAVREAAAAPTGLIADAAFSRLDGNGDGSLALSEFLDPAAPRIAGLADLDGDGTVSRAEFDRLVAALPAR
jgi:hypothetical protein